MKALVALKRVLDYGSAIRIRPDKLGIDLDTGKMVMNPFCEIALEEALKLKEQQIVREVVAISVGDKQCKDVIRSGLAMGADRGIAVITEQYQQLRQLQIARLLAAAAGHECPDLFLFGKQSIDTDANQTGQMVAGLLGWPQATCASSVSYDDATRTFQVTKEVDNGMETVKMGVPVVITADLRLNTPRYASLKNIMQAKKKNIEEITPEELGVVQLISNIKTIEIEKPEIGRKHKKLHSPKQILEILEQRNL